MKSNKISLILAALLLPLLAGAQNNVRFKLDYDACTREYVAKIVPVDNISNKPISSGSQFTLIFPGLLSPDALIPTTTSGGYGTWNTSTSSESAYTAGNVFYKTWICNGSGPVAFSAGVEYEIFRFRYTTAGTCVAGLRLMNNTTDPIDAGVAGLDYSNYWLYNAGQTDTYVGNVSGAAVSCTQNDFGDLAIATWPVARAVLPSPSCATAANAPAAWDATTNPVTAVWAGAQISGDSATVANGNTAATTDNFDDGLTPPAGPFTAGAIQSFTLSLNANRAATTVHYRVWFDWNADGNFANDNNFLGMPATYAGSAIVGVPNTAVPVILAVTAPSGALPTYAVRLAVSDAPIADIYRGAGGPASVLSLVSGEIEDYSSPTVLPVQLLSFDATKEGGNARLDWVTAQEVNSKAFIIERSTESNREWTSIGTVAAAGNSDVQRNYSFIDAKVLPGVNLYRLRMVDLDGSLSYSQVRTLEFGKGQTIHVFPNPAGSKVNISGTGNGDRIALSDITGRVIMNFVAGNNSVETIDFSGLSPMTYLLKVSKANGHSEVLKVVKQ